MAPISARPDAAWPLARVSNAELYAILGKPFPVLDDGFIRLIDYMGDDSAIVQAARVSYGTGTKRVSDDRSLLRYLMRHEHTTPFEMCELKHSTRYSVASDSAQRTEPNRWRSQSVSNRQGSGSYLPVPVGDELSSHEKSLQTSCRDVYEERLAAGVAREQARRDLPLSTFTEAYWKSDLHNIFRFLRLRMAESAQAEIREYAKTIGEKIVADWCPDSWAAFQDYQLGAVLLSKLDAQVVGLMSTGQSDQALDLLRRAGLLKAGEDKTASGEGAELADKLRALCIEPPWEKRGD